MSPQINKYNEVKVVLVFAAFSAPVVLTAGIKKYAFDYLPQGKHAKTSEG